MKMLCPVPPVNIRQESEAVSYTHLDVYKRQVEYVQRGIGAAQNLKDGQM